MNHLYENKTVETLKAPNRKWVYYLLQFTWGLPMNIIGAIVALVLVCFRKRPYWYGWNLCFELPVNFGLDLGIFFIAPINGSTHTKNHEHGHGIQNIYFGPFTIGMVSIPSAARFWVRELMYTFGTKPTKKYDDIWFEGQATKTGDKFIEELK
jgi:hypothetical protein